MTDIDDGGSAYPHDYQTLGTKTWPACPGMTLRDYFAAQVLTFMLDGAANVYTDSALAAQCAAEDAYEAADAMLIARAAKGEE